MKQFFSIIAALVLLAPLANAQPGPGGHTYKSGYSSMMTLGKDIHNALEPRLREMITAQPISIDTDPAPYVRLFYIADEPRPARGVSISAGFIDLVNQVAHAKAIDSQVKGYFARYAQILARETGAKEFEPLPDDSNPAFWSEDMLNEQLSNFNSIVGIVVGIKLAHHCLGHYDKYKDRLQPVSGGYLPINQLLTPKEWEDAFRAGVKNALQAGCTIEGVIPFFEAIEKMKPRPAWAAYFMPEGVKLAKLKKDMETMQSRFFNE